MQMDFSKKLCNCCKEEKSKTEFGRDRSKSDGLRKTCTLCRRKQRRLYNKTQESISKSTERMRKHANKHPFRILLARSKRNHKVKGFTEEFEITESYLKEIYARQDGKCFWSGIHMKISDLTCGDLTSASVDRLDCNKGYTKGNIVLTTKFFNIGRGNTDKEAFLNFLEKTYYTGLDHRTALYEAVLKELKSCDNN